MCYRRLRQRSKPIWATRVAVLQYGIDEAKGYMINIAPKARVCRGSFEPVELSLGRNKHLGVRRRLEREETRDEASIGRQAGQRRRKRKQQKGPDG